MTRNLNYTFTALLLASTSEQHVFLIETLKEWQRIYRKSKLSNYFDNIHQYEK